MMKVIYKYKILILYCLLCQFVCELIEIINSVLHNFRLFNGYIWKNPLIQWLNHHCHYKSVFFLGFELLSIPLIILFPLTIFLVFKKFYKQININRKILFYTSVFKTIAIMIGCYGVYVAFFILLHVSFNPSFEVEHPPLMDFWANPPQFFWQFFFNQIKGPCFVGGVAEELYFRLILFVGLFYYSNSFLKSVMISSLIFYFNHIYRFDFTYPYYHFISGYLHFHTALGVFIFGGIMCLILIITRNPLMIIACHFLYNFCNAILHNRFKDLIYFNYGQYSFDVYLYTHLLANIIVFCLLGFYLYKNKHLITEFYERLHANNE